MALLYCYLCRYMQQHYVDIDVALALGKIAVLTLWLVPC